MCFHLRILPAGPVPQSVHYHTIRSALVDDSDTIDLSLLRAGQYYTPHEKDDGREKPHPFWILDFRFSDYRTKN